MIILLFILLLSLFSQPALATDINVICPNDPDPNPTSLKCTLTPDNLPLFDETNIAPGFLQQKIITVNNQDTDNPCFLKAETIKKSGHDLLLDGTHRLNLSITSNSDLLYSGPVIFGNLSLDKVDIGSTRNYYWTVSFPQSANNDYQALSAVFDINLKFTCADNPNWQPPVINPQSGVFLSEFMPQPPSNNEWVEIFNNNDFDVILDGWQIDDLIPSGQSVKHIPFVTISAQSFYVFDLSSSAYLNNGGDDVNLIDNTGQVIENVSYDTSSTDLSWSKQMDGTWCQSLPTKGNVNDLCYSAVDGAVGGATTTSTSNPGPSQCTDAPPGTPSNLTAVTLGGGQVKLDWTHANPPYTSYLVAYGPADGDFRYGNPNIGTDNNYTVSGLTPGAQYCFYVRAQNGCMPGKRSNVVCVNRASSIPIVETSPPPGFEPGILGETSDEKSTEIINLPDIMGETDTTCTHYHIPLLFLLALLINSLYFNKKPKDNIILPVLISLSTGLVDWFVLKEACCSLPSDICRFFPVGNLISLILPYLVFRQKHN